MFLEKVITLLSLYIIEKFDKKIEGYCYHFKELIDNFIGFVRLSCLSFGNIK